MGARTMVQIKVSLREAAQILGCTYERARQLHRAEAFGPRLTRKAVVQYAHDRATRAQAAAVEKHAKALDELYTANREIARIRGLMS